MLFLGFLIALSANRYSSKASLLLTNRIIINEMALDSPKTIKIKKNMTVANIFFYIGFSFTSIGIILQTCSVFIENNRSTT